jgi:hypothetical protein
MLSHLSSLARSGVIALTALASLTPAASGAPLGPVVDRSLADNSPNKPILVWQGEGRDFGPGYRVWPRVGGGRHWGGGWNGGGWNGGGWNGGGHWRRGGWGHGGWGHGGWGGWGSGFALGLGLGLPLGYYGGGYYGGGYYDAPYRPRYYYRGGGSGHEQWCYSRYRSYRAWDNSWQPYYGPRRQCISPYD